MKFLPPSITKNDKFDREKITNILLIEAPILIESKNLELM
jgi:hypothetical protein